MAGSLCRYTPHDIARTELTEKLVADLKARRSEALGELLDRHGAEIKAVAFLIVRNEQDAEETLTDTLLTAWRKIDSLRDPRALRSWLLTTATRLALRRRRRPQPRMLALEAAHDLAVDDPSPLDRLALAEAIDRLPPRMRAVIALYYVADMSAAEVSAALGTRTNTVKTQLREARARLRLEMAPDHPQDPIVGRKEVT